MRILHLVENYLPLTMGWIYSQINCSNLWSANVGAIHRSPDEHYSFSNVSAFTDRWPIFRKGRMRSLLYRFPCIGIFWLRSHFMPGTFDLLHCHFGNLGFWALPLKKRLKIPMITMFYGYDATRLPFVQPVWRKRYYELFKQGELFLVEGNHMKKTLMNLGCGEEKIRVFHLGVDVKKIPFKIRKHKEGKTLKLLAAGSFREKKGLPYAIEAFAYAKKEYPNMTLTIIGDSSGAEREEKEKREIIKRVSRNNVADSVTFMGFQSPVRFMEELQNHHLFISPSVSANDGDTEGGSPVAITEASAAGLPIISTYHCDIPEVVLHKRTGLLVEEKNVEGLKESILFFLKDSDALENFGQMGRTHVESQYNINMQLLELKEIYQGFLK